MPDLSHVFDDSRPQMRPMAIPVAIPVEATKAEKRIHNRFDKAFPVMVESEMYGDSWAIARNVSAGGILVEMPYAPPLGTVVTIRFQHAREDELVDELVVRAEVKHHHYLNFTQGDAAATRAIGMRFLEFVDAGESVAPERLH